MVVAVKSVNGMQTMPVDALLGQRRIGYVCGEITDAMAIEFVQQIMYLNYEDDVTPIKVFINSGGGEINSGMMMYDVIQKSRAPIQLYCIGKAYSMAAVLLACGKKHIYDERCRAIAIAENRLRAGLRKGNDTGK